MSALNSCDCEGSPLDLASFHRATAFLASTLDLNDLLLEILKEGMVSVNATRGFVALVNRGAGQLDLRIVAGQGWETRPDRALPIRAGEGHGISVWVAVTGEPYVSGDVTRDPHYVMYFADVRSEIAVPLVDPAGAVIGVLNIESEEVNSFTQRDLQLLLALANQAAIAITVAEYREQVQALIETGNQLAMAEDMDSLLPLVVQRAMSLVKAEDGSLFQLNPGGDRLMLRASGPRLESLIGQLTYRVGEGLTGWVAQHGQPTRVADVRKDPRWRGLFPELDGEPIESFLATPIRTRQGLWGVLRVVRQRPAKSVLGHEFCERDELLLRTLARQVGAAITQQMLVDQQVQMQRMAAWGEMSARSAHMIGNKVFAIKGQLNELEHLARQPEIDRQEVFQTLERARRGVSHLEEILNEFRDFLMATQLDRRPVDVNELVRALAAECFCSQGAVRIHLDLGAELPPASLDENKMRRALGELFENAALHQPEGGDIFVTTGAWGSVERELHPDLPYRSEWERGALRIEVRDTGPGILDVNRARLFTPFFTTRSKGMGLGLSIVKGIIDAHQGAIAEIGREGQGAHFLIVLPCAKPVEGEPPATAQQLARVG